MKFLFSAFLACLCFAASAETPQPPEIAARSYLLLDVTANQILAAKDIDAPGARLPDHADDGLSGV